MFKKPIQIFALRTRREGVRLTRTMAFTKINKCITRWRRLLALNAKSEFGMRTTSTRVTFTVSRPPWISLSQRLTRWIIIKTPVNIVTYIITSADLLPLLYWCVILSGKQGRRCAFEGRYWRWHHLSGGGGGDIHLWQRWSKLRYRWIIHRLCYFFKRPM